VSITEVKILCLVRMGRKQKCINWLFDRQFLSRVTCVVSSYQPLDFPVPQDDAVIQHKYAGGKWPGIFDFFARNPDCLEHYDYFFFPDDDIETTARTVLEFFDIVTENRLELAQPALKADSYFSHIITLARSSSLLRCTNFVELMLPLMTRSILRQALPLFENTVYGWGLDGFWSNFAENRQTGVAIVDAVPVGHYRPLAGKNATTETAQYARNVMHAELNSFKEKFGRNALRPAMFSARLKSGKTLRTRARLILWNFRAISCLPSDHFPKKKTLYRSLRWAWREASPRRAISLKDV